MRNIADNGLVVQATLGLFAWTEAGKPDDLARRAAQAETCAKAKVLQRVSAQVAASVLQWY